MNTISEKNYLSSKDAGAILGYTHDYVSRLCRQGKMSGIQKGREWFVTMEEIELFKMRHEVELAEKKKELSKKFSQIRKEAEAKKRKARSQVTQSVPTRSSQDEVIEPKQVTFKFPKQLAAAIVLFLCIMIPSFISSSKNHTSRQNFTNISEQRVENTMYAQLPRVSPTASIFTSIPYGTELFFSSISQLPYETYISLKTIGEGYLKLYLLQGEAIYYSFANLHSMGATVLVGYELIGESFWYGSQDIMDKFSELFSANIIFKTIAHFPKNYMTHVAGGFEYVKQDAKQSILSGAITDISTVGNQMQANVMVNVSAISNTIASVTHNTTAYIGSLFEFNLIEKEEKIRAIKLQK